MTATDKNLPRYHRFFNEARPFDATKDDCLLDAMQQTMELMQDCGISCGFTIEPANATGGGVVVSGPDDRQSVAPTVREAIAKFFNTP